MKKFMILGTLVALVVAALALPAFAQHSPFDNNDQKSIENRWDNWQQHAENRDYNAQETSDYLWGRLASFYGFGDDQNNSRANDNNDPNNNSNNDDHWWSNDHWWNNDWHDNNDDGTGISQENEQNVQSGAVSQGIIIEGGGDNSNQCVGLQPIANTGNATSNTSVIQYGNEDSGVGVSDSGNFNISPSQSTVCDQRVNQAATASGR